MSDTNSSADIVLDIEEDTVLLNIEVTDEKPFNKCLNCEFLSNGCCGPNLSAMTVERACEFLQLRRLQLKLSYQKVADMCALSVLTVKRILSGKVKDPGFTSMSALSYALVSDIQGKYPCAMHLFTKQTNEAVAECKAAQDKLFMKEQELERVDSEWSIKTEFLHEQVKVKDEQLKAKDKILDERRDYLKLKDRAIAILGVLTGLFAIITFALLVL